jgi:hypothetical protein
VAIARSERALPTPPPDLLHDEEEEEEEQEEVKVHARDEHKHPAASAASKAALPPARVAVAMGKRTTHHTHTTFSAVSSLFLANRTQFILVVVQRWRRRVRCLTYRLCCSARACPAPYRL